MPALLLAVRDRLRAALSLGAHECEVQPDGYPHPAAGEVFYAVHPGYVNQDLDTCMDESYEVKVTITAKTGQAPLDRWGTRILTLASTGLYARAEAVRALLHMNETVRASANTTIGAQDNGFTETLRYRGMGPPTPRGPEWFSAEDESVPPAGLSLELTFGGARRVQVIEEQS
jgi:hypothetical protein